jgi:hypothetical protein
MGTVTDGRGRAILWQAPSAEYLCLWGNTVFGWERTAVHGRACKSQNIRVKPKPLMKFSFFDAKL